MRSSPHCEFGRIPKPRLRQRRARARTTARPPAAAGSYRPQRISALLNLGDGTALGTKWGLVVEGRWVLAWKHRIDRAFVRQFQLPP
jgi:hypothetical protein